MSNTTVTYPIVSCLDKATSFLKTDNKWSSINDTQDRFLKDHFRSDCKDLERLQDVLDTLATKDNEELMAFFEERGFEFEIDPFDPNQFGVGSVLCVLVEWLERHEKHTLTVDGKQYDGVRAEKFIDFHRSFDHSHPIVELYTKSGEKVFLTVADKELEGLDLAAKIKKISSSMIPSYDYDGAVFPMVDLDQEIDISWLVGCNVDDSHGMNWEVAKAEQKTRFKMNHIGAKAESAVSLTLECCCFSPPKPDVVIDKPFFVWMTRDGCHDPLFMGYLTEEDWKDPGNFHE